MRGYTQQEVGRPHAPAPNRFARGNGYNPPIAFKLEKDSLDEIHSPRESLDHIKPRKDRKGRIGTRGSEQSAFRRMADSPRRL